MAMDWTLLLLVGVAFVVGVFNVVVGPTGGVMAGAVTLVVPPPAGLVLHAGVSWWSSLWRSVLLREKIRWIVLWRLAAVSLPAITVALALGVRISADSWRLLIASWLVLWAVSGRVRAMVQGPKSQMVAAVGAGLASAFIGAGGVIVMPIIRSATPDLDAAIATEAALTVLQNTVKIALFVTLLRVSWDARVSEAVAMMLSASAGLWAGQRVRHDLSEETRERLLKVALLCVAAALVVGVAT